MKKSIVLIRIIILGSIVFSVGVSYAFFVGYRVHTSATFDYQKERRLLAHLMATQGAQAAYTYFKTAYTSLPQRYGGSLHILAHWMGAALYDQEGIGGLQYCDSSYIFGCFHGFFARAFAKEGNGLLIKAIPICAQRAAKDPGDKCFHGIGHGLLFLESGYDGKNLEGAVARCDELPSGMPQRDCRIGMFMEYNAHMFGQIDTGGQTSTRPYDPVHPHEPCDRLFVKYQPECYIEQVTWLARGALHDDFAHIIRVCNEVIDPLAQDSCFRGISIAIVEKTNRDTTALVGLCRTTGTSAHIENCLRTAVELYIGELHDVGLARTLCFSLNNEQKQQCSIWTDTFRSSNASAL